MNRQFRFEFLVEVADKVKFRQNAHTYNCQDRELLVGQGISSQGDTQFPTVKLHSENETYIPGTKVRISLVDVKSHEGRRHEHYLKLINCRQNNQLDWHITKDLDSSGVVEFRHLGVVKTTRDEKPNEIFKRLLARREEAGEVLNHWEKNQLRGEAANQVGQITEVELKLYVEAYVYNEVTGRVVKLAEIYSRTVQDLNNPDGTIMIREISRCSDTVRGGEKMMMFIGGKGDNVGYNNKKHDFQVVFFETKNTVETWRKVVRVPDDQLHTIGHNVAGLSFRIPIYDPSARDQPEPISSPTQNTYFRLEKKKNSKDEELVASSGRFDFTYKPLPDISRAGAKRKYIEGLDDIRLDDFTDILAPEPNQNQPEVPQGSPANNLGTPVVAFGSSPAGGGAVLGNQSVMGRSPMSVHENVSSPTLTEEAENVPLPSFASIASPVPSPLTGNLNNLMLSPSYSTSFQSTGETHNISYSGPDSSPISPAGAGYLQPLQFESHAGAGSLQPVQFENPAGAGVLQPPQFESHAGAGSLQLPQPLVRASSLQHTQFVQGNISLMPSANGQPGGMLTSSGQFTGPAFNSVRDPVIAQSRSDFLAAPDPSENERTVLSWLGESHVQRDSAYTNIKVGAEEEEYQEKRGRTEKEVQKNKARAEKESDDKKRRSEKEAGKKNSISDKRFLVQTETEERADGQEDDRMLRKVFQKMENISIEE